jgi:hypothetical protein
MGRLKGLLTGGLIVLIVVLIEYSGHRLDNIYAGSTPEISAVFALLAILGTSYLLKADGVAFFAVFVFAVIYGIAAFFTELASYYHDYPQSFFVFLPTIILKAVFYSLPVLIASKIVEIRSKRKFKSGG